MSNLRYKAGDRVRIKSFDWYNKNKDSNGDVVFSSKVPHFSWCEEVRTVFTKDMVKFCGKVVTIESVWSVNYSIVEGTYRDYFTDEMIEGLVEEPLYKATVDKNGNMTGEFVRLKEVKQEINLPEGYIFKDENGNVINTQKIVLEKRKKEYPKTFLGCCDVLNIGNLIERGVKGYKAELFDTLQKLYICRDAYWKIAGEEMGLGKPWEPNWCNDTTKYCISYSPICRRICKTHFDSVKNNLAFPTPEMRDAFKENFDKDLETCKELL